MHAGRVAAAAVSLLLSAQLAGCGREAPRGAAVAGPPVSLTRSGACGDAFFWAATASGDTAVTVAVDVRDRTAGEPTTVRFSVPDPAVDVTVLRGRDLARNFCTDLADADAEPTGTEPATAGTGAITVSEPLPETTACGHGKGTLSLNGLVAEGGAVFAPIRFTSDSIGCYSG